MKKAWLLVALAAFGFGWAAAAEAAGWHFGKRYPTYSKKHRGGFDYGRHGHHGGWKDPYPYKRYRHHRWNHGWRQHRSHRHHGRFRRHRRH